MVTMTAPATPRVRRTAVRPGRLVVNASVVPDWVAGWCDRSGRTVAARPADAGAIASGPGDSVLIPRAEPPRASRPQIVAVVRSLPDDAGVLVDALDAAAHLNGQLVVLHGVPVSFGERSVGRAEAVERGHDVLRDARALVEGADTGVAVEVALVRAWPHEIVGELLDADLLVLGGPRVGSSGRIGLVAGSAVRHAPCAVLLAPRPGFPPSPGGSGA
jgi:nucleotide-binding universal stress UspA family protein